jgi:hypothetical protein
VNWFWIVVAAAAWAWIFADQHVQYRREHHIPEWGVPTRQARAWQTTRRPFDYDTDF